MGGTAYNFVRRTVPLPSKQIITDKLQKVPIEPGLSPFMINHLQEIVQNVERVDRFCVLQFDEIEIQPRLEVKGKLSTVYGTVNYGKNGTNDVANHALVFQIQGINSGWLIPVSYEYTKDTVSTIELKKLIVLHVKEINSTGFIILGLYSKNLLIY